MYLGLPSEQKFMAARRVRLRNLRRFFLQRPEVAVIGGGGNTAVEEALYLTNIASHVHHRSYRRDKFRAEAILVEQAE